MIFQRLSPFSRHFPSLFPRIQPHPLRRFLRRQTLRRGHAVRRGHGHVAQQAALQQLLPAHFGVGGGTAKEVLQREETFGQGGK